MFGEPRRDGFTPPADETVERVEWWAEIFEPPCVGYAAALDDIAPLADAGADFVALADAIWGAPAPLEALARGACDSRAPTGLIACRRRIFADGFLSPRWSPPARPPRNFRSMASSSRRTLARARRPRKRRRQGRRPIWPSALISAAIMRPRSERR